MREGGGGGSATAYGTSDKYTCRVEIHAGGVIVGDVLLYVVGMMIALKYNFISKRKLPEKRTPPS